MSKPITFSGAHGDLAQASTLTDELFAACRNLYAKTGQEAYQTAQTVDRLLNLGANPNAIRNGQTLLSLVCDRFYGGTDEKPSVQMVVLARLLQHPCIDINDVNRQAQWDLSPLDHIFTNNPIHYAAAELLLQNGADHYGSGVVFTPMVLAKQAGREDLVALLEKYSKQDGQTSSSSSQTAISAPELPVVKAGIDRTPVIQAALGKVLSQMDVNALNNACESGDHQAVEQLLAHNAAVLSDALVRACGAANKQGHVQIVTALVAKGAQVDFVDETGSTPLLALCARFTPGKEYEAVHLEILRTLLTNNANPNVQHSFSELTPLELIVNPNAIEVLLEYGADPSQFGGAVSPLVNAEGKLAEAQRRGNMRTVEYLTRVVALLKNPPIPIKAAGSSSLQAPQQSSAIETQITIAFQTVPGFNLFIRGDGPGMNQWMDLVPLNKLDENTWVLKTAQNFDSFEYKLFLTGPGLGEGKWEAGDNHRIACGKKESVAPRF